MARPRSKQENGDEENAELISSDEVRTALITGETFGARAVTYSVIDGLAMFEGDIVLGTVDEVEQQTEELRDLLSGELAASAVITGAQFRWPNCTIPMARRSRAKGRSHRSAVVRPARLVCTDVR